MEGDGGIELGVEHQHIGCRLAQRPARIPTKRPLIHTCHTALELIVQEPYTDGQLIALIGNESCSLAQRVQECGVLAFVERVHQHVHGTAVQPVMRLHAVAPLAMPPAAIRALTVQNRQ